MKQIKQMPHLMAIETRISSLAISVCIFTIACVLCSTLNLALSPLPVIGSLENYFWALLACPSLILLILTRTANIAAVNPLSINYAYQFIAYFNKSLLISVSTLATSATIFSFIYCYSHHLTIPFILYPEGPLGPINFNQRRLFYSLFPILLAGAYESFYRFNKRNILTLKSLHRPLLSCIKSIMPALILESVIFTAACLAASVPLFFILRSSISLLPLVAKFKLATNLPELSLKFLDLSLYFHTYLSSLVTILCWNFCDRTFNIVFALPLSLNTTAPLDSVIHGLANGKPQTLAKARYAQYLAFMELYNIVRFERVKVKEIFTTGQWPVVLEACGNVLETLELAMRQSRKSDSAALSTRALTTKPVIGGAIGIKSTASLKGDIFLRKNPSGISRNNTSSDIQSSASSGDALNAPASVSSSSSILRRIPIIKSTFSATVPVAKSLRNGSSKKSLSLVTPELLHNLWTHLFNFSLGKTLFQPRLGNVVAHCFQDARIAVWAALVLSELLVAAKTHDIYGKVYRDFGIVLNRLDTLLNVLSEFVEDPPFPLSSIPNHHRDLFSITMRGVRRVDRKDVEGCGVIDPAVSAVGGALELAFSRICFAFREVLVDPLPSADEGSEQLGVTVMKRVRSMH